MPRQACDCLEGKIQWTGDRGEGFQALEERPRTGPKGGIPTRRIFQRTDDILQRFYKEVSIWKTFHHSNILPLLGVKVTEEEFTSISKWMENGNINEFVRAHPDTDLLGLVRSSFGSSPP